MPPFRFTLPIVTPSRRRSAGGAARGVTTRLVVALALALLSLPVVGGSALADGSEDGQNQGRDKALVCKYVGNPGQDERLKGGKNPIEVGNPSVDQGYFNDAHGRSYVLSAEQTECPPGDDGGGEEPQFDPYEVTVWWSFDNPPAQWPQTRTEDPGEVPARACEAAGYQYDTYWIRDEGDEDYLAHLQHLNSPADDARLDPHDYGLRRTTADPGLCPQDDLSVSKTAIPSYDRDYDWTITKDVDTDHRDITPDEKASFDYTVTATPAHRDSSFRVAGTITVTNPNSETVTATISDKIEDGPTCAVNASDVSDAEGTQVNVPADGADYDYTCTMPQTTTASTDGTNTVSLAWNTHDHPGTSGHADASTSFDFADATVHTTHRYVTVTDNQHQLSNNHLDATDGKRTFTYTKKFPGEDGTCTDYDNTATLQQLGKSASRTVTVCVHQADLSVSKTAIPSYDRDYDWTITKDVDTDHRDITPDEKASFDYTVTATPAHRDSSFRVAGTITVTNPNSETVTATISDKIEDGPTCAVNASDVSDAEGTQVNVPADGADYDYTCTMPQTTTASTDGTNTVSLAWNTHDHPGTSGHADASTSFDFADATVHTTHRYVTVTDNQHQLSNNHLDATDGKRTFTYTKKFPGEDGTCTDYDNTATLQQRLRGAQGPQGDQGPRSGESTLSEPIATASKTVTVCVQKALTVTKTAQASYDRTYDWTIDKDVDRTKATIDKGDSADFDYTVTATPNGFDDSGWELSGAITVTNPNAERVGAITADVTDQVSIEGVTCTVDGGTGVTIPAGGTKKLSYTCETGELDPSDYTGHTNTATVTWDGGERSATGSTQVVFHPDVETDDTIPIFDDKVTHTGDPKKLGTATWNANGTPRAFHYTLTQTGVAGQCTDYTNTALANHLSSRLLPDSLTGTDTAGTDALPPRLDDPYSASQTVTVCVRQPVLISRTDESTFDRTYDWKITKEVDKTTAQVTGPDTARFTYTVTATPVGRTDSNEQLGGVITLTNPNTFAGGEITTDVTQTPDLGEGITCSVVDGSGVVVPAGESVEVRYTCTREKNADLSLDPATERDRTIEVYDDQVSHADDPVKLGPAEWNAEGTPTEFTYTLDLAGTPDGCADRTNTAFVPDRELKAAATVRVCSSPEQAPVELPQAAPPVAGLVTGPVVEPSAESLPSTGAPSGEGGLLTLGFGALLVGGWLVLSGRRRARRY